MRLNSPRVANALAKLALCLPPAFLTAAAPARAQAPELVVQTGHTGMARPVGFSADGRALFTAGYRTVKMWDAATGRELRTIAEAKPMPKGEPILAKLSPDGKLLVTSESKEYVRYWDAATGLKTPWCFYACEPFSYGPFEFSPDSRLMVSRGPILGWSVIDLQTHESRYVIRNLTGVDKFGLADTLIGFSPDGKTLAFRDYDKRLRLWRVATGKELALPGGAAAPGGDLAFSPGGAEAAAFGKDKGVWLIDLDAGRASGPLKFDAGELLSAAFSPDGRLLALGGKRLVLLCDAATGKVLKSLPGHGEETAVPRLLFTPDGRALLANGENVVKVWDVKTGAELRSFGGRGYLLTYDLSPDGRRLNVMSAGSMLEIVAPARYALDVLDMATGKRFTAPSGYALGVYSPDGAKLAVGGADVGSVRIFDVATWKELSALDKHADDVLLVALSPDGSTLASSVGGGAAADAWGMMGKDIIGALMGGAMSELFTAGTRNREVKLWDIAGGREPVVLRGHSGVVRAIAFSPDGRSLATAGEDGAVKLWDVAAGKEVRAFRGSPAAVTCVAFSHDGRTLASASLERGVKLWDVATGAELKTLKYSQDGVTTSLAFSPDDRTLAAGVLKRNMLDNLVLWDVAAGREVRTLSWDKALLTSMAFSADGRSVAARNSQDGAVKLLDLDSGAASMSFPGDDREAALKLFAVAPDFYGKSDDNTFTPGGNVRITRGANARINFSDPRSGELLASLIALDENDWAVVAPDGRFDTNKLENPRGLHWLLPGAPPSPLSFEVFMRDYFEPRLLPRLLRCAGRGDCAGEFKPIRNLASLNRTQPDVRITRVAPAGRGEVVEVSVSVESADSPRQKDAQGRPLSSGVYDVRLFRDGQLVGDSTPGARLQETFRPYQNPDDELEAWRGANRVELVNGKKTLAFKVRLPAAPAGGKVEFSAYAFNADRVKSETSRVTYAVPAGASPAARPRRAYVINFGVNSYDSPAWNLQYAADDARALRESVSARLRARGEFAEVVEVSLISDGPGNEGRGATKANVRSVLELLAGAAPPAARLKELERAVGAETARRLRRAGPEDLLLISFSSHGYADRNGVFYILPSDIGANGERAITGELLRRAISSDELSLWFRDVDAGEMVMIVDACQAASAVEGSGFKPGPLGSRGLGQLAFDKGMKILAAAQAANAAVEVGGSIGHGLLTYALVRDGLENGAADFRARDKVITLREWLEYGEFRVPGLYKELAAGRLKGSGAALAELAGSTRAGAPDQSQRPSLFDFTPKKAGTILARLP